MKFSNSISLAMAVVAAQLVDAVPQYYASTDLAPSASAPSGCVASFSGTRALSVETLAAKAKRAHLEDLLKRGVISEIGDGQIQAPTGTATAASTVTAPAISQISDGQPQAGTATAVTVGAISQISDGQVQAPTAAAQTVGAITQISDGQVQAPTATSAAAITVGAISQISDGQVQAPTTTLPGVTQTSDGQPEATQMFAESVASDTDATTDSATIVTCDSDSLLKLTLKDTVLTDAKGRIGYIASNYQFQFDYGGQAGEIYTEGFTSCSNGSLALGGSEIFYQCLSGDFYNLYDRYWAAQCEPVRLVLAEIEEC